MADGDGAAQAARDVDGAAREQRAESGTPEPGSRFTSRLIEIADHLAAIVRIRAARRRVRWTGALLAGLGGLVLTIAAIAAGLDGVRLLASGLLGGLTEAMGGRVWLAELATGALLLAGIVAALVAAAAWNERRTLQRLKRRHGIPRE